MRSGHDPLLVAEELTDFTLKFGTKSKELKAYGITLLICIVLLMCSPILYLW